MFAFSNATDVRALLKNFQSKNEVFEEFESRQRTSYENMRQAQIKTHQSPILRFLSQLFNSSSSNPSSPSSPSNKSLLSYEERKLELRSMRMKDYENEKERLKIEFEKQMKANKEYLASQKMGLLDLITKGPAPPPQELLTPPPDEPPASHQASNKKSRS